MTHLKRHHNPFFPALMDELLRPDLGGRQANYNVPAVNIRETENAFEVELSAPGKPKEDFNIELDKNLLTISSDVKNETTEDNGKYTRKEFTVSSFKRSFTLPETIAADDIKAAYENGILKLTLPKKEEALPKAKRLIDVL
ncbi:Hsp20/alpha crystallin family protein [Flavobacterium silvaticum]|uniref:Hsp20/alpha crystallin family protein n=1 Tax=Flavobacterium silvaticum TaxID=1852020 RepID=A0A972FQ32_9FLAO|nr:Hsp20/alpha crystallin family protein [Flavobacterium silvaticum]NMH29290.1 Hsp20/alpha crystallin family protein [Flavobacterium silvaticum]